MFLDISHPEPILSPWCSVSCLAVPGSILSKPVLHTAQSALVLGGGPRTQTVALVGRRHTVLATLFPGPSRTARLPADVCGGRHEAHACVNLCKSSDLLRGSRRLLSTRRL